ncbi:MAG: MBL fold metallo-hydrolase [Paracoccus sp. (in: a-proteobacteria)]|nr:MBL fold metallo-hydrolase [Paracoccus sp. (in: a-proteobacteria)]
MELCAKDLIRVLAGNPSPLTGPGTNSFVIGDRDRVVIDPGPDDPAHLDAVWQAAQGQISHIIVTHAHLDHSAGAARLAQRSGAPVLAFGTATAGRSPTMQQLAQSGMDSGGEGLDLDFRPDVLLHDDMRLDTPAGEIVVLHTPGHAAGHLCLAWRDVLFSGDIVMGWSSTLISPPDGDLCDYMRSLSRIAAWGAARLLPAHGPAVEDPPARLSDLAAHRRQRTAQILATLIQRPGTAEDVARRIYEIPEPLIKIAARNVLAHLLALYDLGAVETEEKSGIASVWRMA